MNEWERESKDVGKSNSDLNAAFRIFGTFAAPPTDYGDHVCSEPWNFCWDPNNCVAWVARVADESMCCCCSCFLGNTHSLTVNQCVKYIYFHFDGIPKLGNKFYFSENVIITKNAFISLSSWAHVARMHVCRVSCMHRTVCSSADGLALGYTLKCNIHVGRI